MNGRHLSGVLLSAYILLWNVHYRRWLQPDRHTQYILELHGALCQDQSCQWGRRSLSGHSTTLQFGV
jgi:hypothetical protein